MRGRVRSVRSWPILLQKSFSADVKILRAGGATFAYKMRGTSRPHAKFTGDFGNAIEVIRISGRSPRSVFAKILSPATFDFCNTIGPFRTSRRVWLRSGRRCKADIAWRGLSRFRAGAVGAGPLMGSRFAWTPIPDLNARIGIRTGCLNRQSEPNGFGSSLTGRGHRSHRGHLNS